MPDRLIRIKVRLNLVMASFTIDSLLRMRSESTDVHRPVSRYESWTEIINYGKRNALPN